MDHLHVSLCCEVYWPRIYTPAYVPTTSKDRAYEFHKVDKGGGVCEIRSKGQYESYLKRNGLEAVSKSDLKHVRKSQSWRDKRADPERKSCIKRMSQRIQSEGLIDAIKTHSGRR